MGADKASLEIGGAQMAVRIAQAVATECGKVTVLGREPLPGLPFVPDVEQYAGPLVALSRYAPTSPLVFVAACDMPLFAPGVVGALSRALTAGHDAAVPSIGGRAQPLCALYRAECWPALRAFVGADNRRMMDWLRTMRIQYVEEGRLAELGVDAGTLVAVNTPEELEELLSRRRRGTGG